MKSAFLIRIVLSLAILTTSCSTTNVQPSDTAGVEPTPTVANSDQDGYELPGKLIYTIDDGDFVHPRLSPDGSRLAYSRVLIEDVGEYKQENTEVVVFDLKNNAKNIVLTAKQARKYSTYASFVYKLQWLSNRTLRAFVSDGDVDSTQIDFDVEKQTIIAEKYLEPDWNYEQPKLKTSSLRKRLSKAYPDAPPNAFDDAIYNDRVLISGDRVLTQIRHVEFDDDIVLFDIASGIKKIVLELPRAARGSFLGGFVFGTDFVFGVNADDRTQVYLYRNNEVKSLLSQPTKSDKNSFIEVKFVSQEQAIFLLTVGGSGANRESATLWLFQDDQVRQLSNYPNLYDFDYNDKSKLAAFCYWTDQQRHISIFEITN